MKKILKFKLDINADTYIRITDDSHILNVKVQHGQPVLWVEVGEGLEQTLIIRGYLTGFDYYIKGFYIGTIMLDNDNFVVHYYGEIAVSVNWR